MTHFFPESNGKKSLPFRMISERFFRFPAMILLSMTACLKNHETAAMAPMVTNKETGFTLASQQYWS